MTMRHMGRMDKHHYVHLGAICFIFAKKILPLFLHHTTGIKRQKCKSCCILKPYKTRESDKCLKVVKW